jgi:predicted metal-binding membrane protein
VLRRDRIVVAAALAALAALAWGYVLWLRADMNMGGMDMTGFRMIPGGLGIMAPANAPWKAIEFAFVFAMWAVMMVGMMDTALGDAFGNVGGKLVSFGEVNVEPIER